MYNKKYRLKNIETEHKNSILAEILGKVCYLAYFKAGERGLFLCDIGTAYNPIRIIYTSEVSNVHHTRGNQVIVSTENTKYVFEVILDGKEN